MIRGEMRKGLRPLFICRRAAAILITAKIAPRRRAPFVPVGETERGSAARLVLGRHDRADCPTTFVDATIPRKLQSPNKPCHGQIIKNQVLIWMHAYLHLTPPISLFSFPPQINLDSLTLGLQLQVVSLVPPKTRGDATTRIIIMATEKFANVPIVFASTVSPLKKLRIFMGMRK